MSRIFRVASYFVLLTFVLNLGDWPFVDEILAEQSQVQYEAVASNNAPIAQPAKVKADHSTGIYESLVNLADMPVHHLHVYSERRGGTLSTPLSSFTSASLVPFDRPPIFS